MLRLLSLRRHVKFCVQIAQMEQREEDFSQEHSISLALSLVRSVWTSECVGRLRLLMRRCLVGWC